MKKEGKKERINKLESSEISSNERHKLSEEFN
jgi:hypothetical protein